MTQTQTKNQPEKSTKIPFKAITSAPAKMFTYPTRLASAWRPGVMEINLPAEHKEGGEVEVTTRPGSTQSLGLKHGNAYKRLYRKFVAPIQLDGEYIYDARYETDGNIAHLLAIVACTMLLVKPMYPKVRVILRAKATTMAKTAYKLLGIPVLCTDKEVSGDLLLVPDGAYRGIYEGLYKSLYGELDFEGYNKQTPDRVFISRRGTRCLINEYEIEQALQEYGFKKVYFEDIPVNEQWSIARNAKVVVGMHGAALSSLVFNRNQVKLLELFHPGYVVDMYRWITNAVDGTWCGVTGQITEDVIKELDFKKNGRSFALSSTLIDITSLRRALDYLDIDRQ